MPPQAISSSRCGTPARCGRAPPWPSVPIGVVPRKLVFLARHSVLGTAGEQQPARVSRPQWLRGHRVHPRRRWSYRVVDPSGVHSSVPDSQGLTRISQWWWAERLHTVDDWLPCHHTTTHHGCPPQASRGAETQIPAFPAYTPTPDQITGAALPRSVVKCLKQQRSNRAHLLFPLFPRFLTGPNDGRAGTP